MIKYDNELVYKYINGEDIEDYSIEELENDTDFMIKVIELSGDRNIYNLCSESVKQSHDMVMFLILKYKNDIDFIIKVADKYLHKVDDSIEKMEVLITMFDLTKKKNQDKALDYKIMTSMIFSGTRTDVEVSKSIEKNVNFADRIGMGFLYMFDLYNSSEIVTNFFARKTIDAIFFEYDIDFEKLLHSEYKTIDELKSYGFNRFMIDFIRNYDEMLASYVSTHIELLSDYNDKLVQIINNWEIFNNCEERIRYDNMMELVQEYMDDSDSILSVTSILYYIAREMGIDKKLAYYDGLSEDEYEDMKREMNYYGENEDESIASIINSSFQERKIYSDVKKIMINAINGYEDSNKPNKSKGEIIQIK